MKLTRVVDLLGLLGAGSLRVLVWKVQLAQLGKKDDIEMSGKAVSDISELRDPFDKSSGTRLGVMGFDPGVRRVSGSRVGALALFSSGRVGRKANGDVKLSDGSSLVVVVWLLMETTCLMSAESEFLPDPVSRGLDGSGSGFILNASLLDPSPMGLIFSLIGKDGF